MLQLSPVERRDTIAAPAFVEQYRRRRRPVVLAELTRAWPARATWSVDYLQRVAGHRRVPVHRRRPSRGREHQHVVAARMSFGEFLERLRAGDCDLRIFFLRVADWLPELRPDFAYPDLGVHFVDKLSVLFVAGGGVRVQMHFDVDHAEILLCHFGGRKRVFLFPPDQTPYLYRVPFSFSARADVTPDAPDYATFPALARAHGFVADLAHGDALYIPAGYWHYVCYDDLGFSLSLRTLPGTPRDVLAALYNILVLRTVDGLMRRTIGQRWNDRNARAAVERVHRRLGLG